MSEIDRQIAGLDGLPRKNGELVFDAPWESRAFGMAVALNQQGAYEWEEFRQQLIAEIGHTSDDDFYASWLRAFEKLLLDHRTVTPVELAHRTAEFLAMERDEIF